MGRSYAHMSMWRRGGVVVQSTHRPLVGRSERALSF